MRHEGSRHHSPAALDEDPGVGDAVDAGLKGLRCCLFLGMPGKPEQRVCVTGSLQEPGRELRTAHILTSLSSAMTRLQAPTVV